MAPWVRLRSMIVVFSGLYSLIFSFSLPVHIMTPDMTLKIVIEYDQEIPKSKTADKPIAQRGRAIQQSQRKTPGRQTKQSN